MDRQYSVPTQFCDHVQPRNTNVTKGICNRLVMCKKSHANTKRIVIIKPLAIHVLYVLELLMKNMLRHVLPNDRISAGTAIVGCLSFFDS